MRLNVNYNELEQLAKNVKNLSIDVEKDISTMLNLIDSISSCWTGSDSDKFRMNSSVYIQNIRVNTCELKNISNFIQHISGRYREKDINFHNTIKKEEFRNE